MNYLDSMSEISIRMSHLIEDIRSNNSTFYRHRIMAISRIKPETTVRSSAKAVEIGMESG